MGEYRRRHCVTYQTLAASTDGDAATTWSDLFTDMQARIMPVSSREAQRGRQMEPTITHVVDISYRSNISPEGRLLLDGRTRVLNITGVIDPDERKRTLLLDCVEQHST